MFGLTVSIYDEVNGLSLSSWHPAVLRLHARNVESNQRVPLSFGQSLRAAWLVCWRSAFVFPAALAFEHGAFLWDISRQPFQASGQLFLDGFLPIVIVSVPALLLAFALLPILVKWMLPKQYSGFTFFVTRPLETEFGKRGASESPEAS